VKTPISFARRRRLCQARRLLRSRFCRDERGMSAVEFAIISPIFFFLMFVIAETALVFIAEQVMDNAVFETARIIRTGQAQTGTWNTDPDATPAAMSTAQFKTAVCAKMSVFIDCDSPNFYLDVQSYGTFGAMVVDEPLEDDGETFTEPGAFEFGSPNDIVVVRAYYQWPTNTIFGSLSLQNMGNGKRMIGSFAAFCNEPYETTAAGCG
jgi:Flp pilus assembly protein TadG